MKRFRMKAYLLLTLLLTAYILPGCGGDAGNGHWDKPRTGINPSAPTVMAVVPAVNATAVPINTKLITAAFSKAMDDTTLTITSFTLTCDGTPITGGGAVTYLDAGFVATLPLPTATDLPGNALCTATITTAATALDGNALTSNYEWTFRTALVGDTALPQVQSTVPATTTPGPTAAISNTPIQAIFTEDMDAASITAPGTMTVTEGPGNTSVAGALIPVTYNVGTRTATFIPLNPLTDGVTYTVTIKGTGLTPATDVAFNALAGDSTLPLVANDYVWSFTPSALVVTIIPGAVCPVDASPTIPTVTMSDPTSDNQFATTSTMGVVNSGKLITATFSLEMDPTTIASVDAPLTFTIKETLSENSVAGTVTMDATNKIATFTTDAALLPDTAYTASITTDAMSAGTPPTALACPYEWNFKTATPAATGLAPINPGMLASYGIASAGGLTNSGATTINGDVVLNPNFFCNDEPVGEANDFGLCGGSPPINNAGDLVITQTYPDTTTADEVRAALLVKWGNISPAQTPGATVLGCGTIGTTGEAGAGIGCNANATLPPGAYISATNSTIVVDGQLTLDGQGNPDAVFIFQAPSALTMAVNSQIVLIGEAKASNVWWYVGSDATLNGGTISQGNILASSAISMGTLATSCGRLLSGAEGAGAFTFLSNTVSVPGHPFAPTGCE